jgi:hypothetical protein
LVAACEVLCQQKQAKMPRVFINATLHALCQEPMPIAMLHWQPLERTPYEQQSIIDKQHVEHPDAHHA